MKAKAVLFDIDGTLFSSEGMIHGIYSEEFLRMQQECGRPAVLPTLPEIMAQIGKPVVTIFQNLAPDLSEAERHMLSDRILQTLVRRILAGEGEHYPGVSETLQQLHKGGLRLFSASNGRYPYVESILKANGTLPLFVELIALDNKTIRSKGELVAHTLSKHGLSAGEAVLVGDRAADRDAALSNGCPFVGCLYGHGTMDELEGAVTFLQSIRELPGFLELES